VLLVGGWFLAFAIVKGSYIQASVEDTSLLRLMMPAFPAFVLLIAALPLLLPHAPAKLRAWRPPPPREHRTLRWSLVGATLLVSAVLPLAAIAAAKTGPGIDAATVGTTNMPVPANVDLHVSATVSSGNVTLRWRGEGSAGGPVFYRIWRGRRDSFACPPSPGARLCSVTLPEIGVTHATEFREHVPRGRWTYRVAVAANWLNDPTYGDVYLFSRPLRVAVP
jgi:hypothetical protein